MISAHYSVPAIIGIAIKQEHDRYHTLHTTAITKQAFTQTLPDHDCIPTNEDTRCLLCILHSFLSYQIMRLISTYIHNIMIFSL